MAKLRLGVIGAGSWAVASHLPNFANHRDVVEFVGVNRLGRDALERIRAQFGFAMASEDYRDVLAQGIDICVIASPTHLHYEHATAAMAAGAHILLEKPMTIHPQDAWDLAATARRLGRHLLVAFGWNYRPMIRGAKDLMRRDGGIGAVEQVMIAMSSATREILSNTGSYPDADPDLLPEAATWSDPARSGGGYGQAQLSHALALAFWLTDLRVAEVFGFTTSPLNSPVELHDASALRFTNGAIGTLWGGSFHRGAGGNKHYLEVRAIGAAGQIDVDVERERVWRYRPDAEDVALTLNDGEGAYDCIGPVETIIALAAGQAVENCSPPEVGAKTVETLDALYRSAQSGQVARIDVS